MSISINEYNKPQLQLTGEDRQFIELINNRITAYGQIPYTVPQKLIIDIIKESALMFYRYGYWRSQQVCFYRLAVTDIIDFINNAWQCPNHKNDTNYGSNNCQQIHEGHHVHPEQLNSMYKNFRGYAIKLPAFINDIRDIWESNKSTDNQYQEILDSSTEMVFRQQMSPYGYSLIGINSQLYQYEVCARVQQQAAYQSVMGTSVPFRYNNSTKTLIINKKIEKSTVSLMLQCDCNVDVQNLYIDDLFIQFVIGRTKQELRRILGGHTIPLPGDVTLNVDDLCYHADEDVEDVKTQLRQSTGIGDIILQR